MNNSLDILVELQTNESVFLPRCISGTSEYNAVMNKKSYLRRSKGWKFISRSVVEGGIEGLRIWRIG